jgi:hypothetical protein
MTLVLGVTVLEGNFRRTLIQGDTGFGGKVRTVKESYKVY